ncbi:MAG: hypothetical protein R3C12_08000 [Planctomycetaceae bacterium]|nr:hypothetical protein [Planctomycetaceae bacterium]
MTKSFFLGLGALLLVVSTAQAGNPACCDCCYPMPNMIGDFISLPDGFTDLEATFNYQAVSHNAGGAGRNKASQNNNILPQDRIFLDASWSDNALFDSATDARAHDVHRTIFGIEKVLNEGLFSVELRLPMINGYDSNASAVNNAPSALGTEFGNMYVGFKRVLWQEEGRTLTAGLGVTLPTGNGTDYMLLGDVAANIENETAYLKPYLAYSRQNGATFFQVWSELDLAVGGDEVSVGGLAIGEYQSQNLYSLDMQLGRWLYYNPDASGIIKGIAPIVELHYTTTINDTDNVSLVQNFSNPFNRMDFWNITMGTQMQLGNRSNLRLAASLPIRNGSQDETHASDVTLFLQWDVVR